MAQVFISYAPEDRAWVRELVGALTTAGFGVFWDVTPGLGQAVRHDLDAEIANAGAVIAVWSNASRASNWVRDVAQEALDRSILFPVLKDIDRPPLGFRQLRSADLRDWPEGPGGTEALTELIAQLRERLPATAPLPPAGDDVDFERSTIILKDRDHSSSFAAPTQAPTHTGSLAGQTGGLSRSIPRVPAKTGSPGDLRAGDEIGQYKIVRRLGAGGFGAVYEAANIHNEDERVALKLLLADVAASERFAQLLKLEANALLRLKHPAVVQYRVFGRIADTEQFYLVTEFIPGPTLRDWRRKNKPTLAETRTLAVRLAQGLSAAHRRGIVHRDLAPDNVIVAGDEIGEATLIDFGIARMGEGDALGGAFAGKFSYAAPEQFEFDGSRLGPSIDIYSFGLLLAAFVRGRPLDMGRDVDAAREKRRGVPPLDDIPSPLVAPLTALLQPDPADRPRNMDEVTQLFARVPDEEPLPAPVPVAEAPPAPAAPVEQPASDAPAAEPIAGLPVDALPEAAGLLPGDAVEAVSAEPAGRDEGAGSAPGLPPVEEAVAAAEAEPVAPGAPADVAPPPPYPEREKTILVGDPAPEPGVVEPPPAEPDPPRERTILVSDSAPPVAGAPAPQEVTPPPPVEPARLERPLPQPDLADEFEDDEFEDELPPPRVEPEPEPRRPVVRSIVLFMTVALVAAGATYLLWPKPEQPAGPVVSELPAGPQPAPTEPQPQPPSEQPPPSPAPQPVPEQPAPETVPPAESPPQERPPEPPPPEPETQPPAPQPGPSEPGPQPGPTEPQPQPQPIPPAPQPPETPPEPQPQEVPPETPPADPGLPVPTPKPEIEPGPPTPAPEPPPPQPEPQPPPPEAPRASGAIEPAPRGTKVQRQTGKAYGTENAGARIVYVVRRETTLKVVARDTTAIDRTLAKGDSYRLPDRRDIRVSAGDAGALDVILDGKFIGRAGPDGARLVDFAVTPQAYGGPDQLPQPEEPSPPPPAEPAPGPVATGDGLANVNAIRKANDLREVKSSAALKSAAASIAASVARADQYSTFSPTDLNKLVIASGYGNARAFYLQSRLAIDKAFDYWYANQRSILTDPNLAAMGLASAKSASGKTYWILVVAYPAP